MRSKKVNLGVDVHKASTLRIRRIFDSFSKIYVSFSGGKDSSVMMHLMCEEARKRRRKIGMLFVDLEGQYKMTIDHIHEIIKEYEDVLEVYWICLPLALRNAVSMYEPKWCCWEQGKDWIRQPPLEAITDPKIFPWFYEKMEFEDFVVKFGEWYAQGELTACAVGIRTGESLNRYRTITNLHKTTLNGNMWTTKIVGNLYNVYPIYDWQTRDIWIYNGKYKKKYNKLYDYMDKAGLSIHQQRICQPYGDDQRKGLWLFQIIEPETWAKVVARVNGANSGALYAKESGNILGRMKITKPEEHTWESFAKMILMSLPPAQSERYQDKIAAFLYWWAHNRGYDNGIPDYADPHDEAQRTVPSWRRICHSLLRNDYWCKGLSFSQNQPQAAKHYRKIMSKRRKEWEAKWKHISFQ
jgi:predicted phosphoadenosine phosphosulfate sulfurtransferase